MPIRFEQHQKIARYIDPRTGYQETTIACEMRRDPLTGHSGRVARVSHPTVGYCAIACCISTFLPFLP